jgi:hypothetical protein
MRPGMMRASIIEAWHFGQGGLSIAIRGTLERRDVDSGTGLPSNWRERDTLGHRSMPSYREPDRRLSYRNKTSGTPFALLQANVRTALLFLKKLCCGKIATKGDQY